MEINSKYFLFKFKLKQGKQNPFIGLIAACWDMAEKLTFTHAEKLYKKT